MGIRFGEYLQRSSSRAQRTAWAASRPCRRRAARRAAQRADVRREVVEPGAASGDKRLERPLVVVVQAAAPQACQLSSGALPTPPHPAPALRTWSCPTPPLSTALGTGAGTAARPRRSSRGSSPCPGHAAPGRTRASAASSSSQSDGACAWVRWSGARPSRTRAARGAGSAGIGRRTMPSTVIAAKVENETLMGPSSSTRATHPDRAYPYCGYQSRAALWVSSMKMKCSPWYPRSRSL